MRSDSLTGDPCAVNPCLNEGTCTPEDNVMGFTCNCIGADLMYNCAGVQLGEDLFSELEKHDSLGYQIPD